MLDIYLRRLKDGILVPIARAFKDIHPNAITLFSGLLGVLSAASAAAAYFNAAITFWILNRFFDGLDGTVARMFNKTSDFGGYLDIMVDFTVYALIPVGIAYGSNHDDENESIVLIRWIVVSVLEGIYFVNSASLFQLSAILEKRSAGSKVTGELTTVTMPPGLIEGTETVVFYSLFLLFPSHSTQLFALFGFLVIITSSQRLIWAAKNLKENKEKK